MTLPLFARAVSFQNKTAIATPDATYSYGDLLDRSARIASDLLKGESDLKEQRVAFLIPSGFDYVATQWGIWQAGGIAVPLCTVHPRPELEYVIQQSGASILVAHPMFEEVVGAIARDLNLRFLRTTDPLPAVSLLPEIDRNRRALILYTSGTTGKPKGVVTTHANIEAQVTSLVEAWEWTESDRILHVLPMHHIHGIINVLTCALWVGATCEMLPKFNENLVWKRIASGDFTLFMAVPTIYAKLIATWEALDDGTDDVYLQQKLCSEGCSKMRLMVSGSAALPVQILERWQQISGHFLLERYGMTEIGMALSNPLQGERRAGFVGTPLPRVEVRLVDASGVVAPGTPGEIQVKGPGVFLEYWQNSGATKKSFHDGWFCTGDLAIVEEGNYRILGRISVDIIKTGGYKVSALEIEEVLRSHPDILECAVVGVPDSTWGEQVCAALVLKPESTLELAELRSWAKDFLAVYKVPAKILVFEELPRNAMGKMTKRLIVDRFKT